MLCFQRNFSFFPGLPRNVQRRRPCNGSFRATGGAPKSPSHGPRSPRRLAAAAAAQLKARRRRQAQLQARPQAVSGTDPTRPPATHHSPQGEFLHLFQQKQQLEVPSVQSSEGGGHLEKSDLGESPLSIQVKRKPVGGLQSFRTLPSTSMNVGTRVISQW